MSAAVSVPTSPLVDAEGAAVRLGARVGRGGEGEVYAVAGRPGIAAKLLHAPMSADRAAKIEALARLRSDAVDAAAAWPIELLSDSRGRPRGFLMPLVTEHRELHELYSPKSRLAAFPGADAPFLLGVGLNLARAVAVVHHLGCVIGDVNHASVLVSARGLVRLIDCDSFQARAGGRLFTCDVGQALFTPPELQGRLLRGRERTPDHDAFGLAVLLFQLVFMGRHPFAGRHLAPGEMPIERAIAEGRFAYGAGARTRQMAPPPSTLPIDVYGLPIADLFERAFTARSGRPSAREWLAALDAARGSLQRCAQNDRHAHRAGLSACPFCAIEDETGAFLFGITVDHAARDRGLPAADRVAAAWSAVCRIAPPADQTPDFAEALARLPSPMAAPGDTDEGGLRRAGAAMTVLGLTAFILGLIFYMSADALGYDMQATQGAMALGGVSAGLGLLLVWVSAHASASPVASRASRGADAAAIARARGEIGELRKAWARTRQWERQLEGARLHVTDLMRRWEALPKARQARLQELADRDHERQLTRYLNRFPIAGAGIPQVGPTRTAALQSYGVWTAGDATEGSLARVPGFGPQRIDAVLAWRSVCARGFTPGPPLPPDPAELARIERAIARKARALADEIGCAPGALEAARRTIVAERRRIEGRLAEIDRAFSIP